MRPTVLALGILLVSCSTPSRQDSVSPEPESSTPKVLALTQTTSTAIPSTGIPSTGIPSTGAAPGGTSPTMKAVSDTGEFVEAAVWQYHVLSYSFDLSSRSSVSGGQLQGVQDNLNALGSQGWELCGISGDVFIFKRLSTAW